MHSYFRILSFPCFRPKDADPKHPKTKETIFDLDALPRSLAVLGAGPIGSELAQAMARLGVKAGSRGSRDGKWRDSNLGGWELHTDNIHTCYVFKSKRFRLERSTCFK